ncbi:sperm acrosome membrane-associated protein 4-like [Arapaima gigas]
MLFAQGWGLRCYKCNIGFWNMCITTTTSCSPGQSCFNGVGKAVQHIDLKMKGCLKNEDCDAVSTVDFLGNTTYYMNKTCCATDLCNMAPGSSHLPLLSLPATLFVFAQLTGVLL